MSPRSSPGESQATAPGQQKSSPSSAPTVASPKATQHDTSVELTGMSGSEGSKRSIPFGEDIMQIARIGEISAMQKLFESRKFNAGYKDEEGITPLHVRVPIWLP